MSKPTKSKSLGQIAFKAAAWNTGYKWHELSDIIRDQWSSVALDVEAEVLRRIRKKYPLIEYP